MEELLVPPQESQQKAKEYTTPPKWATSKEFQQPKLITPVSFVRLCGSETTAKPDFRMPRTPEGCTYRLTFIDHMNSRMERYYENCYDSFRDDVIKAGVKKFKHYIAQVEKTPQGKYQWSFKPYEGELS